MRSTKVVVGVLLATVLGVAGVSFAAGSADKVYTACYKTGQPNAGWVKLIGEAGLPTTCPNGSTAFTFDQQGQPGTPGAPGAAGAPGSKGDKGDPGASNSPDPSRFRNYTIDNPIGPKGEAKCTLALPPSPTAFVITYEASDGVLALFTSATCSGNPLLPALTKNGNDPSLVSQTLTPGFTVPAGTTLYAGAGSFGWINGYLVS